MYSTTNGAEGTINPAALSSGKEVHEPDAIAGIVSRFRAMRPDISINAKMIYGILLR